EAMLEGIEVRTGIDFLADRAELRTVAKTVVFTGKIDEYYDYCFGELEYRSLRFETETLPVSNYQGNAVVNYTDGAVPWTRVIEHKHFAPGSNTPHTIITREIPDDWDREKVPYYPIGDTTNSAVYEEYSELAATDRNVVFGGRLAEYRYFDMHQVIGSAMAKYRRLGDSRA